MFVNSQQCYVVVVYDILRVFKAIVGADELIDVSHHHEAESVDIQHVEDLRRLFIVLWQASFAQFTSSAIEFPVDTLHRDEQKPHQLEYNSHHEPLSYQPIT